MNGSLVCLSSDDFASFFFATIAGKREPEKLAKGEFKIKLEIDIATMPEITPLITFVMVESHVYFEVSSAIRRVLMNPLLIVFRLQAYRHNLKVLQEFGSRNFPLEKYIVNVNKQISPPSYLDDHSVYLLNNGVAETDPEHKKSVVRMLGDHEWPPREDFKLDESQYQAFRAALTKQMVVIQGPPGKIHRSHLPFEFASVDDFLSIQELVKRISVCVLSKQCW